MNSQDTFKKWFRIITSGIILSWGDMDLLTEELLPGYSFKRSSYGPRAIKYLYDESNNRVFSNGLNRKVGMRALELAADTDYKRAIIDAYKTKIKINMLLSKLRDEYRFNIDIIISDDIIDIRIEDSKL